MEVEISRVSWSERYVLRNLAQFYIYEFTKFVPTIQLNDDGFFTPLPLDQYWSKDNKHPFFVKVDASLAGFVLVDTCTGEDRVHSIAEFFIMRKYEGKGVGKRAAKQVFQLFPGKWRITQVEKNYPAQAFWRSVIAEYTKGEYTERYDGQRRSVQEFTSV